MKTCAIYLDGSKHSNTEIHNENVDERNKYLKKALEFQVGDLQFLISHTIKEDLQSKNILKVDSPLKVINPNHTTSGALASALLPIDLIDDSSPIVLIPTNSLVEHEKLSVYINEMLNTDHDAGVLLVKSNNPNFSYVRIFESKIIEFVEKQVVGNLATTGVFFFRNKKVLLECARWSFVNNQITNNQYYIAPSLNHLLTSGGTIGYQVLEREQYQHSTWTPVKG